MKSRRKPITRKEGNVLFNDALNTFYLRLYGVRHIVKNHSDSERENTLPSYGLLFLINSKGFFYMHHPTERITHTTAYVTPVVEHWLEREIAQWVHPMKDRSDDQSNHERTLLPRSDISLPRFSRTRVLAFNTRCNFLKDTDMIHHFSRFRMLHETECFIYMSPWLHNKQGCR